MATIVTFSEDLEIPFVRSLDEFRAWALSDDFPERGRIDFIAGRIEIDMTPEDYYSHGGLKVEVIGVLRDLVKAGDLGDLRSDRTRVSNPGADLSAEPDVVFISHEAFERGLANLASKASGEADRFVEVVGSPDLVVEIVSDHSVKKDTVRLSAAYWKADIAEYWLLDARGEEVSFMIQQRGRESYEPVPVDAEGFQSSPVLKQRFRLIRRRDRRGGWAFDLEHKDG